MKYETQGGMPTRGLVLAEMTEHLRELERLSALLGHLEADNDQTQSHGWLGISQLLQQTLSIILKHITKAGRMN